VLHAPELIDAEDLSAARWGERKGVLTPERAQAVIRDLDAAPIERQPLRPLLPRAWELRHDFSIYDALYVALAEAGGGALATADERLAAAVQRDTRVALAA
jgi:predicted nucleic acid-binding protein